MDEKVLFRLDWSRLDTIGCLLNKAETFLDTNFATLSEIISCILEESSTSGATKMSSSLVQLIPRKILLSAQCRIVFVFGKFERRLNRVKNRFGVARSPA
jgi:hypothetical protein